MRPLLRESVSSSILNMIIDYILDGHLKPGDRLPTEVEFVEKLGVGRNSVREAIKVLSVLGIVNIKRGFGTFISETMSSSVLEPLLLSLAFEQGTPKGLIELRLLLEIGAAELVIDKASDEEIEELDRANQALIEAAGEKKDDLHALRDIDLNIHFTFFSLTKNPFVEKIARTIYRLFYASIEKTVEIDPDLAYKNHKLIIDAIKKRDKALTKESIKKALAFWMQYINQ